MVSATSRTLAEGLAVTTDAVMISRISTAASLQSPAVAVRTSAQVARRRRIEAAIRVAGPFLDLVLLAGGQLSRVAGRNELPAEPAPAPLPAGSAARRLRRLTRG
jgi:hypothetical protein